VYFEDQPRFEPTALRTEKLQLSNSKKVFFVFKKMVNLTSISFLLPFFSVFVIVINILFKSSIGTHSPSQDFFVVSLTDHSVWVSNLKHWANLKHETDKVNETVNSVTANEESKKKQMYNNFKFFSSRKKGRHSWDRITQDRTK